MSRRPLLAVVALIGASTLACGNVKQAADRAKEAAEEAKRQASTPPMPCDAPVNEQEPIECLSGTLTCGSVVEGTTAGGDSNFTDAFYANKFCFPAGDDHGGPERVYRLPVGAYTQVRVTLQSDCEDLDLALVAWTHEGRCPSVDSMIPECEGQNRRGGDRATVQTFNNPREYLVVVDGKAKATGTYRLSVECFALNQP